MAIKTIMCKRNPLLVPRSHSISNHCSSAFNKRSHKIRRITSELLFRASPHQPPKTLVILLSLHVFGIKCIKDSLMTPHTKSVENIVLRFRGGSVLEEEQQKFDSWFKYSIVVGIHSNIQVTSMTFKFLWCKSLEHPGDHPLKTSKLRLTKKARA